MPRFVVEETVPVWVTYRRIIEAPTAEAAKAAFVGHPSQEDGPLFGDVVEGAAVQLEAFLEADWQPRQERSNAT
jgi:hypothetical protein